VEFISSADDWATVRFKRVLKGQNGTWLLGLRMIDNKPCPHYTRKMFTSCSKSANKPVVSHCLSQVVNNVNNLVDIIRLVTRLFQQVQYSHDITILLQPCVVNLVTFLSYHDRVRLVRTFL
jgi:hypothetical protein